MPPAPPQSRATLAFVTVSLAWGTTYAGNRVAVQAIPPFALAGMRFAIAGAVMMLVLRAVGIKFPALRDWPRLALIGTLLLAVANALMAWALQYIPTVMVALLINVGPLMYVGLQSALGERVPRGAWAGLGIGFSGVLILIAPSLLALEGAIAPADNPMTWLAMGALIVGPFSWTVGAIYASRRPVGCHHLMSAGAQSLVGGVVAFVFALMTGELWRIDLSHPQMTEALWAVVWLIVVGSWLGYVAYMYCVMHLSSPRVAITTYINNVVALAVGWLVLGERLSLPMLLGGAVLVSGVWIVRHHTLGAVDGRPIRPAAFAGEPQEDAK